MKEEWLSRFVFLNVGHPRKTRGVKKLELLSRKGPLPSCACHTRIANRDQLFSISTSSPNVQIPQIMRFQRKQLLFCRKVKKLELVNPQGFAVRAKGCPRA